MNAKQEKTSALAVQCVSTPLEDINASANLDTTKSRMELQLVLKKVSRVLSCFSFYYHWWSFFPTSEPQLAIPYHTFRYILVRFVTDITLYTSNVVFLSFSKIKLQYSFLLIRGGKFAEE